MLFLPELRLKKICDALLNFLRSDLKACILKKEEERSYLYALFHEEGVTSHLYKNYEDAKEIFLRNKENAKYLEVRANFDRTRANIPTIHIIVPQESEGIKSLADAYGDFYKPRNVDILSRGYNSNFGIVVTSDNLTECLLITYILRALLIGSQGDLEAIGFKNTSFNMQDIQVRPELLPSNMYVKGIIMNSTYEETFPMVSSLSDDIRDVIFDIKKIIY